MQTVIDRPAAAAFQAKVNDEIARAAEQGRPLSRLQAVRRVHQQYPELHAELLDEAEANRGAGRR